MNDIQLRQNILDELEFEPSIDAADIGVAAENGIVTLSGHVRTYAEKETAERAVRRVKGVRGIAAEIDVRIFGAKETDDDDIARRAVKMLDWNVSVPKEAVQVRVLKGWVTLRGEVEWQYQKDAAFDAVRDLAGVVGVSNLVTLTPKLSAVDVKKRIEDAFLRDAEVEAKTIRVAVEGRNVILSGNVKTWSERRAAERAAWSAPGIISLDDRLTIG
ncbi:MULTISPECIES: BON domain-containing protein [unclassified Rhizobium]|uniref:BON domain-containing protein n=1 Tax=unclassified Rhizobium TaxID=2613769 RepID=UPI001ADC255C|nr:MULTISPECIES: BON domain-containing protein [unclassified Rhizobium]MBO9127877.1 BON domain-containing protein [Rhizobium sp. 16-488-2b]MBO9175165.1 BON domain-containing protein [Rhizobium sp. 16-488-2a]